MNINYHILMQGTFDTVYNTLISIYLFIYFCAVNRFNEEYVKILEYTCKTTT